ncbi:hypothetical protein FRB99_007006 [Tulasnella sp. 403]|nr:hypothetical protein FRB99_007006 [Tulasnella sp. 403]
MKYREDLLPDGNVRFEQTALLGLILASRQNNFNENIISASREGLDMWLERMQKAALIPKYAEEAQSFIDYYSTASQEFPSTTIPLPEVRSQN